ETQLPHVWVEGEISNFRGVSSSGPCYFSLRDTNAQIDVVAFRGIMNSLKFRLEDGLQVLVSGRVTLYAARGRFQMVLQSIEPKGAGALQIAFEQLKKKLEAEGLFDPARKKPIPALPQKIGIVTSPTGAALRDILTVIDRRFANVEILIYPVKVQGEEAKEEIRDAILYLNRCHTELDVLLVGRGGGSVEDLWAFNEEIVARAIAGSRIPIISCVGHEIDFTIADFVSDLRAPTPSAAAELVVKNKLELKNSLENCHARLQKSVQSALEFVAQQMKGYLRSILFTGPKAIVEDHIQTLDYLWEKLGSAWTQRLEKRRNAVQLLQSKILSLSPQSLLLERSKILELKKEAFLTAIEKRIQNFRESLRIAAGQMEALSPLSVLARGYAIVLSEEGKIIKSALQVTAQDAIRIKLHQGEIQATVTETTLEVKEDDKKRAEPRIEERQV
ncbi:MAG: exodeoxyribonuclease VII large subunit, partial [Elusimicrobia bacterium]|nr:exodeoxyribonuclease VII large subunit [Elusimicrobiota bacterium]